jgi:hypothetical protein
LAAAASLRKKRVKPLISWKMRIKHICRSKDGTRHARPNYIHHSIFRRCERH